MLTLFISRALPKVDGVGGSARIVPPAEALERLNREFCGRPSPGGRFATAVYAVIDTRTMTAEIAGAGHPAAIVTGEERARAVSRARARCSASSPTRSSNPRRSSSGGPADGHVHRRVRDRVPRREGGRANLKLPTDFYIERLARLATSAGDAERLGEALSAFEGELDAQMGSLHRPDDVTALIVGADRPRVARPAAAPCRAPPESPGSRSRADAARPESRGWR
jgi:hypothetical protein